jgi:hypothetical protein
MVVDLQTVHTKQDHGSQEEELLGAFTKDTNHDFFKKIEDKRALACTAQELKLKRMDRSANLPSCPQQIPFRAVSAGPHGHGPAFAPSRVFSYCVVALIE